MTYRGPGFLAMFHQSGNLRKIKINKAGSFGSLLIHKNNFLDQVIISSRYVSLGLADSC
jgi:hypothetical protein